MTLDEFKDHLRKTVGYDPEKDVIEPCACGGYGCPGWFVSVSMRLHFKVRKPFTVEEDE